MDVLISIINKLIIIMMKFSLVLVIGFYVLFLTACQKDKEMAAAHEEWSVMFRKAGDLRNPAEFMSPEEIKEIQDAFERIDRKNNRSYGVETTPPFSGGKSERYGDLLSDDRK